MSDMNPTSDLDLADLEDIDQLNPSDRIVVFHFPVEIEVRKLSDDFDKDNTEREDAERLSAWLENE